MIIIIGGGTAAASASATGEAGGRVVASQVGTESMESDVLDQEASPQEPAVCSGSGLVEAERALGHVFGLCAHCKGSVSRHVCAAQDFGLEAGQEGDIGTPSDQEEAEDEEVLTRRQQRWPRPCP